MFPSGVDSAVEGAVIGSSGIVHSLEARGEAAGSNMKIIFPFWRSV